MLSKKMMLMLAAGAVLDGVHACSGRDESRQTQLPEAESPAVPEADETPNGDAPAVQVAPVSFRDAAPAEVAPASEEGAALKGSFLEMKPAGVAGYRELLKGLSRGTRGAAFPFGKFTMEPLQRAKKVEAFGDNWRDAPGAPGTSMISGNLSFAAKFNGRVVALLGAERGSRDIIVKSQTGYVTSGFKAALTAALRRSIPRAIIRRHRDLVGGNPVDVFNF